MNYGAVYHRAGGQYCYPKNQDELIIGWSPEIRMRLELPEEQSGGREQKRRFFLKKILNFSVGGQRLCVRLISV